MLPITIVSRVAEPAFHIPDVPRRWPRVLLWLSPLLPVMLAAVAVAWQGAFVAERGLRLALGDGPLEYGAALPSPGGAIRLSEVRFGNVEGSGPWLTARSAEVDAGGWWWLLSNAPRQNRLEAPLSRLRVRLRGVEVASGHDPALGELAPSGLSGAPFESAGCPSSVRFDAAGLAESELALDNELLFAFSVDGTRLDTRIAYRLEGSAAIERRIEQALPMPLSALVVDQYPMRTAAETWRFEDLGFSRIRHRRCAVRGEMIALVDEHVEAARRQAGIAGLAASDEAWTLYRRYVRDGGQIELQVRYPQPAPLDGWFDRPRPASLLALSEVALVREDARVRFTPADPYTDGLSGDSPKSVQSVQLAGTLWIDPDKSLVLLEPERAPPPPIDDTPPAATAPPGADDDPPAAASTAPREAPSPAATRPSPPAGASPPTSRVPQPEARIVIVGEQRAQRLRWEQLESKIGARLRITTRTGSTRVIELVAWSPEDITVRQRIGGGMAESRIQREMVREAVEL